MITEKYIIHNPSDSILFGMDAFDIPLLSNDALKEMVNYPGHYTHKIHPLECKTLLYENDFYYCDTLLEPHCTHDLFKFYDNELACIDKMGNFEDLQDICKNAFIYGRFHRDFKLDKKMAEQRYNLWLKDLYNKKQIYTLYYANKIVGFIACINNKLVLHALDSKYRGKGLAKYFWSKVCKDLFSKDHHEITSSVSATNLAAINLYSSLGFKFKSAVDVYHRVVKK